MINKWKLFNFKSVKNAEIETKPLTILAGANSSGKSTVLQSILLISQTLSKRLNTNTLVLNGPLVRLGQFDDVRSSGSLDNQILIGWEIGGTWTHIHPDSNGEYYEEEEPLWISCDLSFDANLPNSGGTQLQPILYSCEILVDRLGGKSRLSCSRRPQTADLPNLPANAKNASQIARALQYLADVDENTEADFSNTCPLHDKQLLGVTFQHNLPNELLITGIDTYFDEDEGRVIPENQYGLYNLPENISSSVDQIIDTFVSKIRYLGPLRDEPKLLYPFNFSADSQDVGLHGENTAAVLEQNKTRQISYYSSDNFEKPVVVPQASIRTLETAVNDWLVYLDVAESVQTSQSGRLGHEMRVNMKGETNTRDLTHVGVGLSQVLPILVMCLIAEKDSIIILEQPELHLHPKVQSRLADFFIAMSLLGKQCIIETHSEYIVNRLRFRAAAAKADTISSLMKIYFVEKENGASIFRDVVVSQYGAIPDWPEGFFDQAQDEAEEIIRAATIKKKLDRGK